MTTEKIPTKKSDKIDYAEITEAEVQKVWPDLCMADRYQIAHEKISQNTMAWKVKAMEENDEDRLNAEFIKEVVTLAESENFHIN